MTPNIRRYSFMRMRSTLFLTLAFGVTQAAAEVQKETATPPPIAREFRAAWVATVENIDWPSKPKLPVEEQRKEFTAILDKCLELNLNAVIFQVRTQADAFYPSKLEPWSEYLTGKMGEAPKPFYDPLQFAVEEAHKRGLQLHVWFNPYRVRVPSAKSQASPDHASIAKADVVRKYGKYLWYDPGEPAAEENFIAVLNDVVSRYDIDGVHIDDYFYPYQVKDDAGKIVPFPDDESYARAKAKGETLGRDDWRRKNVDHLVHRMYDEVKKSKPWVLVGISPFGIWRPGNPPGITGLDQFATLYADARKWQREGWLDYFTPQLYWKVDSKGQSYPKLLGWWAEQNEKQRHLWPGNFTSKIHKGPKDEAAERTWTADDLLKQIEATRGTPGASGNVHFSMKALMQNYGGVADRLKQGPYAEPAVVPASPWLGKEKPAKPVDAATVNDDQINIKLELSSGGERPWQWVVREQAPNGWKSKIVPGAKRTYTLPATGEGKPTAVAVSAISRLGIESDPTPITLEHRN
jgi:uncharacterized lipoprotein YddW (UPF0748 family)